VGGRVSQKRKVESCFVPLSEVVDPTTKEKWLKKILNEKLNEIKEMFDNSIDISGGIEGDYVSFLRYREGDHFDWHLDNCNSKRTNNSNAKRNISLIVQLSDPKDYEEGEVLLRIDGKSMAINKSKNFACAFLSTKVFHKVCSVKSGIRKSLVAWGGRKD